MHFSVTAFPLYDSAQSMVSASLFISFTCFRYLNLTIGAEYSYATERKFCSCNFGVHFGLSFTAADDCTMMLNIYGPSLDY